MAADELGVGSRVELRKHAREREAENARVEGTPQDARFHYHEGVIKDTGVDPVNRHRFYVVTWENWLSTTTTHPASDLKIVRMTGSRQRHFELYGERGLKAQLEREGARLQETIKELWVPSSVRREYGSGDSRLDFEGLHGTPIFDECRRYYEKLVKDFNRKARIHDRDNCC
jgi:hypothetical protein